MKNVLFKTMFFLIACSGRNPNAETLDYGNSDTLNKGTVAALDS